MDSYPIYSICNTNNSTRNNIYGIENIEEEEYYDNGRAMLTTPILTTYRPINLNYPFPGQDGKGRTPGLNWNIEAINQYITNNRGVTTEEVYKKEPLYVIKLDAKKIREIREYNKENKYDDFTLSCTLGKGTECISEFLREHNLIESGTCKDITSDNFYSCADK